MPNWNYNIRPIDVSGTVQSNNAVGQLLQRREEIKRQEKQRLESQKAASAELVNSAFDKSKYDTKTLLNNTIDQKLADIRTKGFELAAKGVNSADMMQALAPQVAELNNFYSKAKTIQQKKEEDLKRFANQPGYDLSKLSQEYDNEIFFKEDPVTGKRVLKTNPDEIDLNAQPIKNILINRPESVTDASGLKTFLDKVPMQGSVYETQTEKGGIINRDKYSSELPFFMQVGKNAEGRPAPIVKGSPIMDGDKPLLGEGGQPAMAVDKATYHHILNQEPGAADYIRGEVRKSFPPGKVPPEDSAAWELQARHILYDELGRGSKAKLSFIDSQRLNPMGQKVDAVQSGMVPEIKIFNNTTPRERAVRSAKSPNENITTSEALAKVFTNDPAYVNGEVVDVDGKNMVDVTYTMPKGVLKYGPAADDVYKDIYFDPESKELVAVDHYGKKEYYNEGNIGQLMSKTATLNRTSSGKTGKISEVRDVLNRYKYQDGKFMDSQTNDNNSIKQAKAARAQEREDAIIGFEASGDVKTLKSEVGQRIGDKKILKIDDVGWPKIANDYYVEYEEDGKKQEKKFKNKKALADWLRTPQTNQINENLKKSGAKPGMFN